MQIPKSWRLPLQRVSVVAKSDAPSGQQTDVSEVIAHALSAAGFRLGKVTPAQSGAAAPPKVSRPFPLPSFRRPVAEENACVDPGRFLDGTFRSEDGARNYKLYVPSTYSASSSPVALLVMLHGCQQSPDDFAAGTQMNRLAEKHGFVVVYPAQSANANGSNCWNWFRAEDQQRDSGEPALIAGITRQVVSTHRIDLRRVFVAGLSAGAAMAVVLGRTYPDLFSAIGAHSGLPYAAAHDVPSAFAAMKGRIESGAMGRSKSGSAVGTARIIVFHGDRDQTVDVCNGKEIVARDLAYGGHTGIRGPVLEQGNTNGRTFTRTTYCDARNVPVVEQWIIQGAGHAWSGGDPRGSYVDACGPSASAAMIAFFEAGAGGSQ